MDRKRPFHGWYIVSVTVLGMCFGYAGAFIFGFSSFILPLSEEFGWSRSAISLGITASNITMICVLPLLGYLNDRVGIRNVLLPATVFFGLVVCSFSLMSSIWHFYILIVALIALGGGASHISYAPLLTRWFEKRKGLALGLGLSGGGLGAMIVPPLVNEVIQQAGWREAYLLLGAINLFVVAPLIFLIVRNRPADVGSVPDGIVPDEANQASEVGPNQQGFTFRQSLRTAPFWKMSLATFLLGIVLTGFLIHFIPFLVEERGITRSKAAYLASLLGVSSIVARILSGYFFDKHHAPFVAAVFLVFPLTGLVSLALIPSDIVAALAVITVGIGIGMEFDMLGFFSAQYFGRLAIGKMYSFMYVLFMVGSSTGVYLAGYSYDNYASYEVALWCGAAIVVTAIVIVSSLGPYPDLPKEANHDQVDALRAGG